MGDKNESVYGEASGPPLQLNWCFYDRSSEYLSAGLSHSNGLFTKQTSDRHEEVHQRDVSWLLPDPPGLADVVAPTLEAGPASIPTTGHVRFKNQ